MSSVTVRGRRRVAWYLLFIAIGMTTASMAGIRSAAAQISPEGWSLSPASGHGHGYRVLLRYSVADKQVIHDAVTLANPTRKAITFDVYAANAFNEPVGGAFALGLQNAPKVGATRWIKPAVSRLTVPAGTQARIPVTIRVPANATPGDLAAGIVALDRHVTRTKQGGQVGLGVQHAVGVRVYLKVAGPRRPGLAVRNVTVRRKGNGPVLLGGGNATISYDVLNTGNTRLDAVSHVKIVNQLGHVVHRFPPGHLYALLPGARIHVADPWKAPRAGRFRVRVTVTSGKITATGHTTVLIVPWLITLGLLGGVGGASVWLLRSRRLGHTAAALRADAVSPATPPTPVGR
jgi:hypothetical protein